MHVYSCLDLIFTLAVSYVSEVCLYTHSYFKYLQFTEEKLGQAEKTELDAHLENLLSKAECTKIWTEKIMKQTEVLLQPNPSKAPLLPALHAASQRLSG